MNDQEKQLISNLAALCSGSRLTADEHKYFENGLQYVAEKLNAAAQAAAAPAPSAPVEKPALAAVPSAEAPSEA